VHGRPELARVLDEFLVDALAPKQHAVLLRENEAYVARGSSPMDSWVRLAERELLPGWGDTIAPPGAGGLRAAPNSTSTPEIELTNLPAPLEKAGIVIVQPLGPAGSPVGAMLLGRKRTERRYIEPDLNLLRRAAAAAGTVLERIDLIQAAAAEAQARRQAEELDRLKSDFLSRVAHDLRTPLASILWSTENLLDGISGPLTDDQAEYLRAVRASAGHLNRLVDNLLEISRLEQGRASFELEPVRLDQVVEQALLTLQPLAQEKRIRLSVEGQATRPVQGNAEKLLEVVLNLVDNAIKYSPRDGDVEIRLAPAAAGWQELAVRDHGPGLGDLDPELLFERFRQGSRQPASEQQGFGLGLYIVRSYVELMGGEVTAANHPAGGAIFACRLPEEGGHHESERADRG
jgi:signal transduction histidine kinase